MSHHLLRLYQRRLTNLSGKNRSLWLPRIYTSSYLDISNADFLLNQSAFSVVEALVERKKTIPICSISDSRDSKNNQVSRQLHQIDRKTKSIFEESGAFDLYVGYPFVEGKLHDDTLVRCPLLFFPVRLTQKQQKWQIELRSEAEISFNKTFLLAYSHFNQIQITETILEETFEDFPKEMLPFLTELYRFLEKNEIEIHFNSENFASHLQAFTSKTRQEANNLFETGKLKLFPQAVLGIFPQAGSYLYQDYEKLIQDENTPDLEAFFHGDFSTTNFQLETKNHISEEDLFTPFLIDASQEEILKATKKGKSFVVQGPPGTGKSQLICNLVSDFVARGKKVLVVCQKRAALDVVHARLAEKEIAQFTALVHDFKQDRNTIYKQLQTHIEELDNYQKQNSSLDAIRLERRFTQISREIDALAQEFEAHRKVLFDETICGKSAKELYLTVKPTEDYAHLSNFYGFNLEQLQTQENPFERNLTSYFKLRNKFDEQSYEWSTRKSFAYFSESETTALLRLFDEIPRFRQDIEQRFEKLLGKKVEYHAAKNWASKVPVWHKGLEKLEDDTLWEIWKNSRSYQFGQPEWLADYLDISEKENVAASIANAEKKWLSVKEKDLLSYFGDGGMEKYLHRRMLKEAKTHLEEYKKQKQSFFRKQWKKLTAPKPAQFSKEFLAQYRRKDDIKAIDALLKKIEKRNSYELKMTSLQSVEWIEDAPNSIELKKSTLQKWFQTHAEALDLKLLFVEIIEYSRIFLEKDIVREDVKIFLTDFVALLNEIEQHEQTWQRFLTDEQIELLLANTDTEKIAGFRQTLVLDFDKLIELDTLKANFSEAETQTIRELLEHVEKQGKESYTPNDVVQLFQNSIKLNWLLELEKRFPILKAVSDASWQEKQTYLTNLINEKTKLSQNILKIKVKEQLYKNLEYNRLGNRVTYRELEHQVKKKRSVWALRKLLANFQSEMLTLLPCWLASPETVSAIFPLRQDFDLVIFDEASQCFAEKGIPALYRAKQSIVAGDEHQLSPHDLYQARFEEDTESIEDDENLNSLALEVDSLLDLGKNYLPSFQLLGHYRSRFPELIAFSNAHFYENRLQVVPDLTVETDSQSIQFLKVEGEWHNNQNEVEAQKVIELVSELLKAGKKDIGVITFNHKQQNLIQDLLETHLDNVPASLFVKNIENVQGDEREIIIFSIGYAPNRQGKFRLNFGSLSQAGGENRLNVAVSRAKEQIFVVSSIFAHQLPVEETHSKGAQLLKSYLEYAKQVADGKAWFTTAFESSVSKKKHYESLKEILKTDFEKQPVNYVVSENTFSVMDLVLLEKLDNKLPEIRKGIITDDERYFEALSAKEFFVYLPQLLQLKGWSLASYWSREVFR